MLRHGLSLAEITVLLLTGGLSYILRDDFTSAKAAGAVNGTASEPGPGSRVVGDTSGSGVSITSGKLRIVGDGTWGHEGFYLTPAITRAAGVVVRQDYSIISGAGSGEFVLTTTTDFGFAGFNNVGVNLASSGLLTLRKTSGPTSPNLNNTARTSGAIYYVLRAQGKYVLYDPQDGNDVELWFWDDWDNTASLYIAGTLLTNLLTVDFDNCHSPSGTYFNIGAYAAASDSFNRANGSLGTTDGAGHTEANGGSGQTWTATAGTWGIASNKAASSALAGGLAFATVSLGTDDVLMECDLTRSAGVVGIVCRYTDSNNYIIAYHDGTNCKLDEVVGGATTNRISAAATYAAGASIRVRLNGALAMLYYNDLYVGAYASVNAGLTGTVHGLYTTDTGNTFDNFILFPQFGYNALQAV